MHEQSASNAEPYFSKLVRQLDDLKRVCFSSTPHSQLPTSQLHPWPSTLQLNTTPHLFRKAQANYDPVDLKRHQRLSHNAAAQVGGFASWSELIMTPPPPAVKYDFSRRSEVPLQFGEMPSSFASALDFTAFLPSTQDTECITLLVLQLQSSGVSQKHYTS